MASSLALPLWRCAGSGVGQTMGLNADIYEAFIDVVEI
jgi:hypothetical protein